MLLGPPKPGCYDAEFENEIYDAEFENEIYDVDVANL